MHFYNDMYGLDFTSIEPNDQGQRSLGNATFEPGRSAINFTYVFNSWLVSGRSRSKCFPASGCGFQYAFHQEYGGEEGKMVPQMKILNMDMTMHLMLVSNRVLPSN